MSAIRTLFPDLDSNVSTGLIPKLEKALILCEILQSSSSNKFFKSEENITYISKFSGISVSGEEICEGNNNRNHFKVV